MTRGSLVKVADGRGQGKGVLGRGTTPSKSRRGETAQGRQGAACGAAFLERCQDDCEMRLRGRQSPDHMGSCRPAEKLGGLMRGPGSI